MRQRRKFIQLANRWCSPVYSWTSSSIFCFLLRFLLAWINVTLPLTACLVATLSAVTLLRRGTRFPVFTWVVKWTGRRFVVGGNLTVRILLGWCQIHIIWGEGDLLGWRNDCNFVRIRSSKFMISKNQVDVHFAEVL